jgi:hypothetical protein
MAGGTLINSTSGSIFGYFVGVAASGFAHVFNYGGIGGAYIGTGVGTGIALEGTLVNGSATDTTAGIYGYRTAVYLKADQSMLINQGSIRSDHYGVIMTDRETIVNGSQLSHVASISGGYFGVILQGNGTLTNSAAVSGFDAAVSLAAAGTVVNNAGGVLQSDYNGVKAAGGGDVIVNAGIIEAQATRRPAYGISLAAGGTVTNAKSGLIEGSVGIRVSAGDATITNAGTIFGFNYAISFAGGRP